MPADATYRVLVISLIWSVTAFACYYLLAKNEFLSRKFRDAESHLDFHIIQVVLQRTWGMIFLGILSALVIRLIIRDPLPAYGLTFMFRNPPPWWTILFIPLVLLITYYHAPNSRNLALYPQFRIQEWTPRILLLNGITWVMFLIAYEFLFRGLLLFGSLSLLKPLPAILLNITFYAVAHLYKGPMETIGSIPFGVLLCYLTILTGNIWTAVVLHSFMALTNEYMSIRAHPGMRVVKAAPPKTREVQNHEVLKN